MAAKGDPNYFRLPPILVMFLIAAGMTLTALCVYAPHLIPFEYLGCIGDLAWYLAYQQPAVITGIWYGAVAIHVSEAVYAFFLAGRKSIVGWARIKWFISTLFFGIGSLAYLLKYDPTTHYAPLIELLNEFNIGDDDDDDCDGGDGVDFGGKEKKRIIGIFEVDMY